MSSDTLTKITEALPDDTASPRVVPRRRPGRFHVERHYARGAERTR
ncbi:hypothetical protein AB0M86_44075 [Streptomyces sp. NPDC051639]